MKKTPAFRFAASLLIAVYLLLNGCGDPQVNEALQLEGTWTTYYKPQMQIQTTTCYGTLYPMADETWEITWVITALNTKEVDITMSWITTNQIITDYTCGTFTGIVPENTPVEHVYGYIDGNHLRVSDQDNTYGTKLYSADLIIHSRYLQGQFSIMTYTGSTQSQVVTTLGTGMKLEKY